MQCSSRVSAYRRELNSHEAAKPLEHPHRLPRAWGQVPVELSAWQSTTLTRQKTPTLRRAGAARNSKDKEPVCQFERPHCVGGTSVQSVRRAAAMSAGASTLGQVPRRPECAAGRGSQRGAGSTCNGPRVVTGPGQAHRLHTLGAALPNPSLKRSANGRPPGPVWRYGVHFRQPGPGVLPLAPA
jgi:hypothetical protein